MALLEFAPEGAAAPTLHRDEVVLRRPRAAHFDQWRALREASRAHLTRWEPDWTDADVTANAFREKVKIYQRAARRGAAAPFFIFAEPITRCSAAPISSPSRAAPRSRRSLGTGSAPNTRVGDMERARFAHCSISPSAASESIASRPRASRKTPPRGRCCANSASSKRGALANICISTAPGAITSSSPASHRTGSRHKSDANRG